MGLASIFPKDVVRIDRFLDDALGLKKRERERRGESKEKKKKNQCSADCTRKGSRLVKKLQPHIGK